MGGFPPQRGRKVLYSYLSRLRTALAVDDTVRIQRLPAGHQLDADDASVDLHRFRDLINQAQAADEDASATIAPYSLRGREHPTVSTPVTWDEVRACREVEILTFPSRMC